MGKVAKLTKAKVLEMLRDYGSLEDRVVSSHARHLLQELEAEGKVLPVKNGHWYLKPQPAQTRVAAGLKPGDRITTAELVARIEAAGVNPGDDFQPVDVHNPDGLMGAVQAQLLWLDQHVELDTLNDTYCNELGTAYDLLTKVRESVEGTEADREGCPDCGSTTEPCVCDDLETGPTDGYVVELNCDNCGYRLDGQYSDVGHVCSECHEGRLYIGPRADATVWVWHPKQDGGFGYQIDERTYCTKEVQCSFLFMMMVSSDGWFAVDYVGPDGKPTWDADEGWPNWQRFTQPESFNGNR